MKKIILTLVILVNGFSVIAFSGNFSPIEIIKVSLIERFVEISIEELPEVVANTVKKDYANATLVKAYINTKEQYKLELKIEESLEVVYIDKEGNWIEETDTVDVPQG